MPLWEENAKKRISILLENENNLPFYTFLRNLRLTLGYSVKFISHELEMPWYLYRNFEDREKKRRPNEKQITLFSEYFGIPMDVMLKKANDPRLRTIIPREERKLKRLRRV